MDSLRRFDWASLALTLALGAAGGLVARMLHLPLALLLGSLVLTGTIAALGLRRMQR